MNKSAAVYDRWLFTLGGGEQVAFAYAETLRDLGYTTYLLTNKQFNTHQAEQKMDVDLTNINIVYLPVLSSKELSQYSEKYDVFINTSYLDYFANRSKLGILSVFFPGQIFLTPYEYLKRALVLPSFRSFFIYPSRFEGFRFDEFYRGKMYKWLGKESSIVFNSDIGSLSLSFYIKTVSFSLLENIAFYLENQRVEPSRRVLDHYHDIITFYFQLPQTKHKRFIIELPDLPYTDTVALVSLTISSWRFALYNLFKRLFPKWEMRLHGGPGITKRSDLESYQQIITISKYCQNWIRRYWGLTSSVIYPSVNIKAFTPAKKKKNHIINIGRFFVTGHNKKQLDMIKMFIRLIKNHRIQDWQLHLIGSVQEGQRHREYFEQCQFEAKGFPIYFHIDISFVELKQRLNEAKIYWHATGLDENPEKNPVLFEHFGITTVEAMAAGCVPVVINRGGQPEIVTEGTGFVYQTRPECLAHTMQLINSPKTLKDYSQRARARSQYFSREKFRQRFLELLN